MAKIIFGNKKSPSQAQQDLWLLNRAILIVGPSGNGKSVILDFEEIINNNDAEGLSAFLLRNDDVDFSGVMGRYLLKAANLGHAVICDVLLNKVDIVALLDEWLNDFGKSILKEILGFDDVSVDLLLSECIGKKKEEKISILNKFKEQFALNDVISGSNSQKLKKNKI